MSKLLSLLNMSNIEIKAFLKKPINFQNICTIYPPSINEVLDEPYYNTYVSLLLITQEELEDQIYGTEKVKIDKETLPTPLTYLFEVIKSSPNGEKIVKQAFNFFTRQEIIILQDQKAIIIGKLEEVIKDLDKIQNLQFIDEYNYFDFQNCLRVALGLPKEEPPDLEIHPRLRQMKAKARYRDKIKAKKVGQQMGTLESIAAICCMGIGLNPLNIGEMSYASMKILLSTFQKKERYQIDIDSLLAGADSKKIKPKYWMLKSDDEKSNY